MVIGTSFPTTNAREYFFDSYEEIWKKETLVEVDQRIKNIQSAIWDEFLKDDVQKILNGKESLPVEDFSEDLMELEKLNQLRIIGQGNSIVYQCKQGPVIKVSTFTQLDFGKLLAYFEQSAPLFKSEVECFSRTFFTEAYFEALKVKQLQDRNIPNMVEQTHYSYSKKHPFQLRQYQKYAGRSLLDHFFLKEYFSIIDIKIIAKKAFETLSALAKFEVIHGDVATKNICVHPQGPKSGVTIIDFELSIQANKTNRHTVLSTATYRAPEILFKTADGYRPKVDVWSLGVVLFEIFTKTNFIIKFGSEDEIRADLFKALGFPSESFLHNSKYKDRMKHEPSSEEMPLYEKIIREKYPSSATDVESFIDLLHKIFRYENRISAKEALSHPFINEETSIKVSSFSKRDFIKNVLKEEHGIKTEEPKAKKIKLAS